MAHEGKNMNVIKYSAKDGWILDRYPFENPAGDYSSITVSDEDFGKTLSVAIGKRWAIKDGAISEEPFETEGSRRIDRLNKIYSLEEWFKEYDMQVNEYLRAVRLGEAPSIHIGNTEYASIEALDTEAEKVAEELKALRATNKNGVLA